MAAPALRPCTPWEIPEDCCSAYAEADPALKVSVARAVTEALWSLSGRRFGVCEHRMRPCRRGCVPGDLSTFPAAYGGGWLDGGYMGQWSLLPACSCRNNCGCTNICEITLPGPVAEITEVLIDGVELGPSLWRIDDFRHLVRRPGTPVPHTDWSAPDNYIEGVLVESGDLLIEGGVIVDPVGPLFTEDKVFVTAGPMTVTVGGQASDEPNDLCMMLQFVAPGDTAVFSQPALITGVTGAATYDPDTGTVTYAGQPVPPRVDPELVTICFLQSVEVVQLELSAITIVWNIQWSDTRAEGSENACWPACQAFNLEPDMPGTWQITYQRGRPVPELGIRAAGALACEIVKLCSRDQSCVLPRNMASMSRQGVTIRFQGKDATNALIEFLPEVALFLRTWNPNGLQSDSGVFRADAEPLGRRTRT